MAEEKKTAKFKTLKSVIQGTTIIPADNAIELDPESDSTKALLKTKSIAPAKEVKTDK